MSVPNLPHQPSQYSDSSDTIVVELTGPGDTTPRKPTGKHLAFLLAEKEKIERCMKERAERESQNPPPKPST